MERQNHYAENLGEGLQGIKSHNAKRKPLTAGNDPGLIGYGLVERVTDGLRRRKGKLLYVAA